MEINTATFVMSNSDPKKCPKPTLPEYAFIGRSNVGKSSLINMLCNHKGLAKTSSTPGKTQLINHFLINENWFLADLPGYGYAKVSKVDRAKWGKMINNYIFNRENLMNTFVLVDVRHKPQEIDIEFMLSLGEKGIPFAIIFTKADKIKQQEVAKNLKNYKTHLLKYWEVLPPIFVTSSEKKRGAKEVLEYVESCNALFK